MSNSTNLENLRKLYENRCNPKITLGEQLKKLNLLPITITDVSLDQAFDKWEGPMYHEHTIAALKYWCNDVEITKKCYDNTKTIIKKVIFNDPATIVLWGDGTKTVVKCEEEYDPEKGLAMAIAKHFLGTNKSKSNYYDVFEKWLPKEEEEEPITKEYELYFKPIYIDDGRPWTPVTHTAEITAATNIPVAIIKEIEKDKKD